MKSPLRQNRCSLAGKLVIVANALFAAALLIAFFGHWKIALIVIAGGFIPAAAAEVIRRRSIAQVPKQDSTED